MTRVVAAIDDSPTAEAVLRVAGAWAAVLGVELRAVHVPERDDLMAERTADRLGIDLELHDGDPTEVILRLAAETDVEVVVIGAHRGGRRTDLVGHIAAAVVERIGVPVLVVPPRAVTTGRKSVRRVLVPLEGTVETTTSVAPLLRRLEAAGVGIVAVHALAERERPRFRDHDLHADEGLTAAFASRWCSSTSADVRLRLGPPMSVAPDVAAEESCDAIALTWRQDLSPGHAAVVRAALADARRPVLLVPEPGPARDGPHARR